MKKILTFSIIVLLLIISCNIPETDELKGSIGKSAYHSVEMIRFLKK